MKSNHEHLLDNMIAAHSDFNAYEGPHALDAIDSLYLERLAKYLTDRGWVQIHREGTPEGEQQITTAATKISAAVEAPGALITTEVASDVFVGLLNPTRHSTEDVSNE